MLVLLRMHSVYIFYNLAQNVDFVSFRPSSKKPLFNPSPSCRNTIPRYHLSVLLWNMCIRLLFFKFYSSIIIKTHLKLLTSGSINIIPDFSAGTETFVCILSELQYNNDMRKTWLEPQVTAPNVSIAGFRFFFFSVGFLFIFSRDRLLCRYGRCSATDNK